MKTLQQLSILSLMAAVLLSGCQSQAVNSMTLPTEPMMAHLHTFQTIADQNQGHRAVGSRGGQASGQYILQQVQQLGLQAQQLPFANRDGVAGQHIFVEVKGKLPEKIIMLGAHYDSVPYGAGINDNASGVAVLLELIKHYQAQPAQHSLMFVFWDSEEVGVASQDYVKKLQAQQLSSIQAYINVDMVGTASATAMLFDADRSSLTELEKTLQKNGTDKKDAQQLLAHLSAIPRHVGDIALEQRLKSFYKQQGVAYQEDLATIIASDTLSFLGKVPVASIILFKQQLKGDVLEFAPCYHQACDRVDLIDPQSLKMSAQAIMDLVQYLAAQK